MANNIWTDPWERASRGSNPTNNMTFDPETGLLVNQLGVPISQASQQTAQQQVSEAPYDPRAAQNKGSVTTPFGNGPQQGMVTPFGSGPSRTGAGSTHAGPGGYGTPFITNSNQWYGKMNNYQNALAASSPEAFWSLFGGQSQGWQPGGDAEMFMAQTYDPRALGAAMFGKDQFTSVEDFMAGQTAIANQLTGARAGFINPAAVVGSVIQALSSGNVNDIAKQNPLLAQIMNENAGNPAGQIQSLISFFGQALSGSMPADVLSAWLNSLQRLGSQFINSMGGNIKNLDGKSFARFLASQLGPTLGL